MMTCVFRLLWLPCLFLAVAASGGFSTRAAAEDGSARPSRHASGTFDDQVKPFLGTYCVQCHGPTKQKGERRFDRLDGNIPDDEALGVLQDIVDQLDFEMMPPKKARQPSKADRQRAVAWLTDRIEQYHRNRTQPGRETVLRRLNSREYLNTVRDLLHLDMSMFDPTAGFPRDQMTGHLDNIGETLVTSGPLLRSYLAAAETVVGKVFSPSTKPPVRTWTFLDNFRQQPEVDKVHRAVNGFEWITLYDVTGADKPEGAYGPILAFQEGVPYDGLYEIRFKAEAVNRLHPYDPEFVGTDRSELLRLGIVPGNPALGPMHKTQPIEPLLAEFDLADEPRWYSVRVWLDAGFSPRFTFRNGLMDARQMWNRLVRKYPDQFPKRRRGGIVENRFNAIKYGKLPQIHIHEVEIQGPFYETWPTEGQKAVLGDDWESAQATGQLSDEAMRRHLTEFASRAYRRPARTEEIDRLMHLVGVRRDAGRSPLEAYRDTLGAVLCSPNFLYIDGPGDEGLSSYELASRLSYFLWSSMPDQPLLDLAESGELHKPEVLAEQVRRMLKDPRSEAFLDGFLDSWLTLRDLGSMPPDRSQFEDYYRYDLRTSMLEETRHFTRYLLDNNLSITNFLDSDFTFIDKPLARLYGLTPPEGHGFEKVTLPGHRRGGLLGQASVLTVTANGIETSPVVRGVWLLTNVLGTPTPPQPSGIEPLDPDVRGAKTIREQFEKHRSLESCNDCHRMIDPPGFALENFDAIGQWRDRYSSRGGKPGPRIDAAGVLPDGRKFKDISGFKTLLADREDQFARCLTEKLLSYALGRTLTPADRPHVDQIINQTKARGSGFRDLVLLVVQSGPFRAR